MKKTTMTQVTIDDGHVIRSRLGSKDVTIETTDRDDLLPDDPDRGTVPSQVLDSPAISESASSRRTPPVIRLLVLATFIVILNETIMINAIPRVRGAVHITAQAAQWRAAAFML